jgi:RNA 3'-terminal phosphate cyclase (ATP)
MERITIDGSTGEGGGQMLRTALALSLVTGKPVRIENVRAGRQRPGLMRQHLTAVRAAAAVGDAEVEGATLGSTSVDFRPRVLRPGRHEFAVGTAGSTTLVLQTVLLPLLLASAPSEVVIEGGTHNTQAPPFDFLARAFLPLLARMGAKVDLRLERAGFYPAGGGRIVAAIEPVSRLVPLELFARGEIRRTGARALLANLPHGIGIRELDIVRKRLAWPGDTLVVEANDEAPGPGNVLLLEIESDHVTEVFTGFGQPNVRAEAVAERVVAEAREYLASGAPVGIHLADQLLLPLALAGAGGFRTLAVTPHTTTNADVIRRFLDVPIRMREMDGSDGPVEIVVG